MFETQQNQHKKEQLLEEISSKTKSVQMSLSSFMFHLMREVIQQNMITFTNEVTLKLQNTGEHAKTLWHFFGKDTQMVEDKWYKTKT